MRFVQRFRFDAVETEHVDLTITIPESVAKHLGDDPRRALLEPVLIEMVQKGKLSVAKAGSLLNLDRWESAEWWTSTGHGYPSFTEEQLKNQLDTLADLVPLKD